jgi:hypothetical protein
MKNFGLALIILGVLASLWAVVIATFDESTPSGIAASISGVGLLFAGLKLYRDE